MRKGTPAILGLVFIRILRFGAVEVRQTLLEALPEMIRKNGIGSLRIDDHLQYCSGSELDGQVLIEAIRHRHQVDRLNVA